MLLSRLNLPELQLPCQSLNPQTISLIASGTTRPRPWVPTLRSCGKTPLSQDGERKFQSRDLILEQISGGRLIFQFRPQIVIDKSLRIGKISMIRRCSSVGQSMRLISAVSGVQIPAPPPISFLFQIVLLGIPLQR